MNDEDAAENEAAGSNPKHHGLNPRQTTIVERAKKDGFVTVDRLAEVMGVSPQTIRRDITELCRVGILRRYHGGASLVSNSRNVDYATRQATMWDAKTGIAKMVAERIPDGSSLFIDIGTTAEAVAGELLNSKKGLRVITNSLTVASMLAAGDEFEVTIAGGHVRLADLAVVGEAAIDDINQYKVDFGILGISGIDPDGTLLDFDYREVRIAQAVINNSRTVYLVADRTKFGRAAMVKVGPLSAVDAVFLDAMPGGVYDEVVRASGVAVYLADSPSAVRDSADGTE